MPNIAYPNQHTAIEIPHRSRGHVIVPDTAKIAFNLDIEFTDKRLSSDKNVVRVLVKKKVLMLGSKEMDTINNADIYGTYKDLYFSEKEGEEKLLQGIISANGLKDWVGAKKADGTAITVTIQENVIKKNFGVTFAVPLDLDFYK